MKRLWAAFGYSDRLLSSLELRRQRAFILSAMFTALVLVVDSSQNYQNGYILHAYEEWLMVPLILLNYTLQRSRLIGLRMASKFMAYLIAFQMSFSFVVPGLGAEIMLFWIATLPLILVLLLELKEAITANVVVVIYLSGVTLFSQLGWIEALFSIEVLVQVVMGYSLFTTLVYLIERSRSEYEVELTDRMRERDVLLKEVHHRVKNNMQLMMSLLGLQAASIDEPKYARLFLDNIDRLSAMSLVHESIYKAENFEKIDMPSYLTDIVRHLQRVTRHRIEYDFAEMTLDMKTAMNLGLILNEAVTNALEHAYPQKDEGLIRLALYAHDKIISMKIRDYGVGLPADHTGKGRLGMTLIGDLTRSLNDGRLKLRSDNGVEVCVYCKADLDAS